MSFSLGKKVNMEVSGASHSEAIEVTLTNLPAGEKIDLEKVNQFLDRRKGGKAAYTTARKETDEPLIQCGMEGDTLTGGPLTAKFLNQNARSKDYHTERKVPRPSHADYVAHVKYKGQLNMAGGGFFSGRMTLPMCFSGAVVMQLLEKMGIKIQAHIYSVMDIEDDHFDPVNDNVENVSMEGLPVINKEKAALMEELMQKTAAEGDSVGGIIECKITGVPIGLGDPIYDSLESIISFGMFGIPAIKGIEFGQGFGVSRAKGSKSNDFFCIKDGEVKTITNNSGGIQGGISNGMPIIFRVAVKPTPSIYLPQKSVDLTTMTETTLQIEGRHDSCIVPRVVPCVEAMSALVIYDALVGEENENIG
ncbi:MAG: chorismate synthase [Lachnospiraceae bacterium]|nr:chorismate synthase [Lachnospiraceae bacterium]